MKLISPNAFRLGASAVVLALVSACTSTRVPAPVEDRSSRSGAGKSTAAVPAASMPGAENAGKPGYYTVKPGDTLHRIALDNGQTWRDLMRWNNLSNPDVIEVGQVLRVAQPGAVVQSSGVVVLPIASQSAAAPVATEENKQVAASKGVPAPLNDDGLGFIWPSNGSVLAGFDEAKNKGLDITGKAGDPVLAAADGQVVYAGAGLRGYGNLIILKHNNTYLTAYAHNKALLVKEDQRVKKGERIAEMGNTDADRVKLHFEVRRLGKPVDPMRVLPAR
jgi:lipoprotein NlpD